MLPTFVIGLREGLEAALIVGVIAAFLGRRGQRTALRQVWIGTAAAVAICVGVAVTLQMISSDLRHASGLKAELEDAAASALAASSRRALVAMAFLAVLREGFETAVFLLATFNASGDAAASWPGAWLVYLVPMVIVVLYRPRQRKQPRTQKEEPPQKCVQSEAA